MSSAVGAALRSRAGRAVAVAVGLAVVAAIVAKLGLEPVRLALIRMAGVFPALLLLEGGILACTCLGLRTLYGPDRDQLTAGRLAHAGLLGYVAMAFMPSGRAFAEATRATVLTPYSSAARASYAAFQMQAACLVANAAISLVAMIGIWIRCGESGYLVAISLNFLGTFVLGIAMLLAGRKAKLGGLLGRLVHRVKDFGDAFDQVALEAAPWPWRAALWELAGRTLQVVQYILLAGAASGAYSLVSGLVAEGTHLVGAAVGEMIPAQIGASEANFAIFAKALGTDSAGAVSIALASHVCQLVWVVGGLAATMWRPREQPSSSATAAAEGTTP